MTTNKIKCIFEYVVQDQPMPILDEEEHYRYLGVPIGVIHNYDNVENLVQPLIDDLDKIQESLLAPWQILDMIRTFIQPSLTFAIRAGFTIKRTLATLRSKLVATVKTICNLPIRATPHYIFAHKRVGGLGLHDPTAEVDVQNIVQAIKMLSSSDPTVSSIARSELLQTVRNASKTNPTEALVSNFLSSIDDRRLQHAQNRTSSIWTRARMSTKYLGIKFNYYEDKPPSIENAILEPVLAAKACSYLHSHVQVTNANDLMALPDQGKVARVLSGDLYANGSTWQYSGLNLRFKDWRFIHRARLNLNPLNSVKSRWSACSPSCRHYADDETLPHVINHCLVNMVAIRQRHNRIQYRLTNAVRFGNITTDRAVPNTFSRLRPDIVIEEDNKVTIIDVTCPFESSPDSLVDAEQRKLIKYEPLKQHFIGLGKQCSVHAFVIGSLGTWYPSNELVLRSLGMTKYYKKTFS